MRVELQHEGGSLYSIAIVAEGEFEASVLKAINEQAEQVCKKDNRIRTWQHVYRSTAGDDDQITLGTTHLADSLDQVV